MTLFSQNIMGIRGTSIPFVCCMLVLSALQCKEFPSNPSGQCPLRLAIEDVGVTDVTLKLTLASSAASRSVTIQRDGKTIFATTLTQTDTTVIDDSLDCNHSYTYKALLAGSTSWSSASLEAQATTMDTTSHDFTFESFVLGNGNSSVLYDCAIVNDTLSYAVGEVYELDSTGALVTDPLNLGILAGNAWTWHRVPYHYQGNSLYSQISWIGVVSSNDIWFSNSTHWNGAAFSNADIGTAVFYGVGSTKMATNTSGVLCIVGNTGTIARSDDDGITWIKEESGSTVNLRDVCGSADGKCVWACGYSIDYSQSVLLLRYDGSWHTIWSLGDGSDLGSLMGSVWMRGTQLYFTAGYGVYRQSGISSTFAPRKLADLGAWADRIRGSAVNNIVAVGANGMIWHFNGLTWKLLTSGSATQEFYSVAVTKDHIIAVGGDYSAIPTRAIIAVGRR